MRAVVYLRQSLDRTGQGAAVDRQRQDCLKLLEDRDWTLIREYVDNDTSASSSKPRPKYRQMLEAVEAGQIDVIIAWHVDRLTRKLTELEELIELSTRTGVRITTVNGDIDLTTDTGRLVGRILASVARGEVERKGARQSRAQQQAAELGKPTGGRRAFGYNADSLTVNKPEARLVKKAYRDLLEGRSLSSIATEWNAKGITTTMGNDWGHGSVRRMLMNPRNVGRRTYRGQVIGDAVWPAIIDADTFDSAHAVLSMPERRTTTGTSRLYLLPGLALCHCGADVMTGRTQHGVRTYRCRSRKGHMSRAAEPIDELVSAVVVARLSRPDAIDLLTNDRHADIGTYRERVRVIEERLADLATGLEEGILTLSAVRASSNRLKAERAAAEAEIASLSRGDVLSEIISADDIQAAWINFDLAQQRAIIDALMTVRILRPLRGRQRFDPETVRIDWKVNE